MRIGDRIKELRTIYGITQVQLAEKAGISRSVISQYESNLVEPTASVVAKLAVALNSSTDYLLGLEDDFGIRVDSKELNAKAYSNGISVLPGYVFYPSKNGGREYIRINFSYESAERLSKGMDILKKSIQECQNSNTCKPISSPALE